MKLQELRNRNASLHTKTIPLYIIDKEIFRINIYSLLFILLTITSCSKDNNSESILPITEITLFSDINDPLLAQINNLEGTFDMEIYGSKTAKGKVDKIDYIRVTSPTGEDGYVFFDEEKRIKKLISDGASFEYEWLSAKSAIISLSYNGSLISKSFADFSKDEITELSEDEYQTYTSQLIKKNRLQTRNIVEDITDQYDKKLSTKVYCGNCPIEDADVFFELTYSASKKRIIPATSIGNGEYIAGWDEDRVAGDVDSLCEIFLNSLKNAMSSYLCASMGGMTSTAMITGCVTGTVGGIWVSGGTATLVLAQASPACIYASTATGIAVGAACGVFANNYDPDCSSNTEIMQPIAIRAIAKYKGQVAKNMPLINFTETPNFPNTYEYPSIHIPNNISLIIKSGNNQKGEENQMLTHPLVVGVPEGSIAPSNYTIEFSVLSGGGELSAIEIPLYGNVQTRWILGNGSNQTVKAILKDCTGREVGEPAIFSASINTDNNPLYIAPNGSKIKSKRYIAPTGRTYYIVDPSNWTDAVYSQSEAKSLETNSWYIPRTFGWDSSCADYNTRLTTYEDLLGYNKSNNRQIHGQYGPANKDFYDLFKDIHSADCWSGTPIGDTYYGRPPSEFYRITVHKDENKYEAYIGIWNGQPEKCCLRLVYGGN